MKNKIIAIIAVVVLITTVIIAQTRRTRDEEFLKRTIEVEELQTLDSTITVCDPDGDSVTISIDDLPEGAVLSPTYVLDTPPDPNECTGDPNCAECYPQDPNALEAVSWHAADLQWTPTYEQQGEYRLHVHAIDDKGGDDWVVIVINVADKNRPPIL